MIMWIFPAIVGVAGVVAGLVWTRRDQQLAMRLRSGLVRLQDRR